VHHCGQCLFIFFPKNNICLLVEISERKIMYFISCFTETHTDLLDIVVTENDDTVFGCEAKNEVKVTPRPDLQKISMITL